MTKRMKRIQKRAPKPKRTRITVTSVTLPDYAEQTKHTIIGNRIVFVEAAYDQDCSNPCEDCDGFGSIRSLSNRHINHIDIDEARELLESDADVVALSYFEHGQCMWMVAGSAATRTPGVEFQWDGTRFAGVWIPDDCVRDSYTGQDKLTRREWMVKQAESACETYTEWANGQCFGYTVKVYKVRRDDDGEVYDTLDDYRRDTALESDSCWGFIGWEYFEREMLDISRYVLRQMYTGMGFSKRAIATAFEVKVEPCADCGGDCETILNSLNKELATERGGQQ